MIRLSGCNQRSASARAQDRGRDCRPRAWLGGRAVALTPCGPGPRFVRHTPRLSLYGPRHRVPLPRRCFGSSKEHSSTPKRAASRRCFQNRPTKPALIEMRAASSFAGPEHHDMFHQRPDLVRAARLRDGIIDVEAGSDRRRIGGKRRVDEPLGRRAPRSSGSRVAADWAMGRRWHAAELGWRCR